MKICFRCKQEVKEGSHYYAFHEYNKEELIKIDYTHKKCWDEFLKQIGSVNEAMGMLRRLNPTLTNMGLLAPEEYVVR